jgi:HPt (histidine-containing phosphotransfer) domain-containing protein
VPATAADEVVRVEGEWLSHVPEFIRLQRANVEGMAQALEAGQREDVRFLAHRAFGGLATFGLAWAARQSRFIEEQALDAPVAELDQRIAALKEHLARVRFDGA